MDRHRIVRTLRSLCLAGMAVTPLAFAGDIVKCIGPGGQVTLTDSACGAGERAVTLLPAARSEPATASLAAAPSAPRTAGMVQARLPRHSAARVPLALLDPPSRSLTRDVLTLKAARQAMLLMDGTAESLEKGRVAGLR